MKYHHSVICELRSCHRPTVSSPLLPGSTPPRVPDPALLAFRLNPIPTHRSPRQSARPWLPSTCARSAPSPSPPRGTARFSTFSPAPSPLPNRPTPTTLSPPRPPPPPPTMSTTLPTTASSSRRRRGTRLPLAPLRSGPRRPAAMGLHRRSTRMCRRRRHAATDLYHRDSTCRLRHTATALHCRRRHHHTATDLRHQDSMLCRRCLHHTATDLHHRASMCHRRRHRTVTDQCHRASTCRLRCHAATGLHPRTSRHRLRRRRLSL